MNDCYQYDELSLAATARRWLMTHRGPMTPAVRLVRRELQTVMPDTEIVAKAVLDWHEKRRDRQLNLLT